MATRDVSSKKRSIETLAAAGDLNAPPGSSDWAIAVRHKLHALIADHHSSGVFLREFLGMMEQHNGYSQLVDPDGQPFDSWEAFIRTRKPWGLGHEPEKLTTIVTERLTAQGRAQKVDPLPAHGEIGNGRNRDDIISSTSHGTSADYLSRRIARDRPDILERMKAGEFKSVRAAAKEAGIVKDPTPYQLLLKAWNKATVSERVQFAVSLYQLEPETMRTAARTSEAFSQWVARHPEELERAVAAVEEAEREGWLTDEDLAAAVGG